MRDNSASTEMSVARSAKFCRQVLVTSVLAAVTTMAATAIVTTTGAFAAAADKVYTIGNYPVDATANDAVAAKEKALADGQQAALKSLFKRLVPVTAYPRLAKLRGLKGADYIDGVSVRKERNSSTQYIASLDFAFQPKAVREVLRREGIPFIDLQAPPVLILPVFIAPTSNTTVPTALNAANGIKVWTDSWKGLDLANSLTPAKLDVMKPIIHADTVKGVIAGQDAAIRILTNEYKSELALVVVAEPDLQSKKLTVTIAGRDAVGPISLKRTYRYLINDFSYATELASLVALGTLEGRWKALKSRPSVGRSFTGSGPPAPVQMTVEFANPGEWQDLRRMIAETPGVEDIQYAGVSGRTADIALRFPGGGEGLADSLASVGLNMRNVGGTWVVRQGG
jgi:Uncharacterized protein conserved in bacteria (DUF2066)